MEVRAETSPLGHLRAGSLTDAWMVMPFYVWPRHHPPVSHRRRWGEKDYFIQSREALWGSRFTVKGIQLSSGAQSSSTRGDPPCPPLITSFQVVSSVKRTVELFQSSLQNKDSGGTGEGCGLLLISNKESEVAQSCPTLCNLMGCSPPGSSVLGISQARVLEWIATSFSRRSSQPRD